MNRITGKLLGMLALALAASNAIAQYSPISRFPAAAPQSVQAAGNTITPQEATGSNSKSTPAGDKVATPETVDLRPAFVAMPQAADYTNSKSKPNEDKVVPPSASLKPFAAIPQDVGSQRAKSTSAADKSAAPQTAASKPLPAVALQDPNGLDSKTTPANDETATPQETAPRLALAAAAQAADSPSPKSTPPGDKAGSPQALPSSITESAPATKSADAKPASVLPGVPAAPTIGSDCHESGGCKEVETKPPVVTAYTGNNIIPIGSGLVAFTTTAGGTAFNQVISVTHAPVIVPGLFSATSSENVIPTNRVFFDYGYFDISRLATPTTPFQATGGFKLSRFDIGVEKTILEGRSSVWIRVPFLAAADNTFGAPIDGIGDVGMGIKLLLLSDYETGSGVSGGVSVYIPTAREQSFTTTVNDSGETITRKINPTFLQPWLGGIYVKGRFFIQEYLGVVIPTDDNYLSTALNNDLCAGYTVYSAPGRILSSVSPILDVQSYSPVTKDGKPAIPEGTTPGVTDLGPGGQPAQFGFRTQVSVSPGLQFGLGQRTLLTTNVVVPVVGPRSFNIGAAAGLNWLF